MTFEQLLHKLKLGSKYAELFDHIINYMVKEGIDDIDKLKAKLKDFVTFCDTFIDSICYNFTREEKEKIAVQAYNYLKNTVNDPSEKLSHSYQHKEGYELCDYDYYDINALPQIMPSLKSTDEANIVASLLVEFPIKELPSEYGKIRNMTIANMKAQIKACIASGRDLKWCLGLSDDSIKKLIAALNYYSQRMLENALEAQKENCMPENLMEWRLEEKKEMVTKQLTSIINSLIDNPQNPHYVFGTISSNSKRKIWDLVRGVSQDEEKSKKMIEAIAQAFTLEELKHGVYLAQIPRITTVPEKTRAKRPPIETLFLIK